MIPLDLAWTAPTECPSAATVEQEFREMTRVAEGRSPAPLLARAEIVKTEAGYRLTLATERLGEHGETSVTSATCEPLKRAATLLLALAAGEDVELVAPSEPAPAVAKRPPPARASAPTPAAPPALAPSREEPWRGALRASLEWSPTLLGHGAFAGRAGVAWLHGAFEAFAGATLWPGVRLPVSGDVSARFRLASAELGACTRAWFGDSALFSCLGVSAGVLHGQSEGAGDDGASDAPLYQALPSVGAELRLLPALSLRAELGVGVALGAPEFVIEPERTVFTVPVFAPSLAVGLSLWL